MRHAPHAPHPAGTGCYRYTSAGFAVVDVILSHHLLRISSIFNHRRRVRWGIVDDDLHKILGAPALGPIVAAPKRTKLSPKGLANIRAGVRKRMAMAKAAKVPVGPGQRPERKMSAAGRARLLALARLWAGTLFEARRPALAQPPRTTLVYFKVRPTMRNRHFVSTRSLHEETKCQIGYEPSRTASAEGAKAPSSSLLSRQGADSLGR